MNSHVELVNIRANDLKDLVRRGARSYIGSNLSDEQIESLEKTPYAYSVLVDGKVLMCGGVVEYWKNRGESWAVIDPICKNNFFALHNVAKRFLRICPVRRIEATIEVDFEAGHRWVKALGFELEASCLKAFFPDGKAASLYSRVS